MAFAKLNDRTKLAALPAFLAGVAQQDGLLVCLLVRKQLRSLFENEGPMSPAKWGAPAAEGWKRDVLEKMLRVVHLAAFFIAGVVRSGQNVTWVTDHDAIAANAARFDVMADTFGAVLSDYLGSRRINHLRCGTTAAADGQINFEVEDIAAIPDLAGGALVELFGALAASNTKITTLPTSYLFTALT